MSNNINIDNKWISHSCESYHDEYNDCKTLSSRLYQYYADGKQFDCEIYKGLMNACNEWKTNGSANSFKLLVDYEIEVNNLRKRSSLNNNVWTYRTKPPHDWNSPLPEWAQERVKNTSWYQDQNKK